MFLPTLVVCINLLVAMAASILPSDPVENEVNTYDFPFVSRAQWQAREPKGGTKISKPLPYVVIHHSYQPAVCKDLPHCAQAMRQMQNFHMDDRKWWDIGYNFAVGGDGVVYEGRGWKIVGAHSLHFNDVSIGICLIGDWQDTLPPVEQMKSAQALIAAGVEMGYLKPDYKLVGHRQVRDTACPGEKLFKEIQRWDHYSDFPASANDLPKLGISV